MFTELPKAKCDLVCEYRSPEEFLRSWRLFSKDLTEFSWERSRAGNVQKKLLLLVQEWEGEWHCCKKGTVSCLVLSTLNNKNSWGPSGRATNSVAVGAHMKTHNSWEKERQIKCPTSQGWARNHPVFRLLESLHPPFYWFSLSLFLFLFLFFRPRVTKCSVWLFQWSRRICLKGSVPGFVAGNFEIHQG